MAELNFVFPKNKGSFPLIGYLVLVLALLGGFSLARNGLLGARIDSAVLPSPSSALRPVQLGQQPSVLSAAQANSATRGLVGDSIRYYETQTGRAFQMDLTTKKTLTLSETHLPGFLRTVWAPDKKQVVSAFARNDGQDWRYYDYGSGQSSDLGVRVRAAVFSPDSRHIALLVSDTDSMSIQIISPGDSDAHTLLRTRITDGSLSWPAPDTLALLSQRNNSLASDLTLIGPTGDLDPLLSGLNNLEYSWSSDGTRLLYSYFETGKGIRLWSMDLEHRGAVSLDLPTSASKCAWVDTLHIVCGVPHNTALSADVRAADSATRDDIMTVDLTDGTRRTVYAATTDDQIGVTDPLTSSPGSWFVFTNIFDQQLYALPLQN